MTLPEIRQALVTLMQPIDPTKDALLLESGRQAWRYSEHFPADAVRIVSGYVVFEGQQRVVFTGRKLHVGQRAEEWERKIREVMRRAA